MGTDAEAVGRAVRRLRRPGVAVAGFVGSDQQAATEMAHEMLGGVDEVVSASDRQAVDGEGG